MDIRFIKKDQRGSADYGWLKANYSYSFASYYHPSYLQFGALRVLNDDWIAPGRGFATHPHENMEIITIPLSGSLEHEDSQGNKGILTTGEVQVMSAGTGIYHSEKNASPVDPLQLFQIWIFPQENNLNPRYEQKVCWQSEMQDGFQELVGPKGKAQHLWINQEAWIHLGSFASLSSATYTMKNPGTHGLFMMVIEGQISLSGQGMEARDAAEIKEISSLPFEMRQASKILFLEIPL